MTTIFADTAPATIVTLDQFIAEFFNSLQVKLDNGLSFSWGNIILCAIAILLSVFLCGLIGLEREKRGRSAGLRTHLLVGFGSTIVMIVSIYGFPAGGGVRDYARLAAQVITGVGFLGAGAIIHHKGNIKGLTTASTIWLVMAIGLACGSMNFTLAIGGTIVVLVVLTIFRRFEKVVTRANPQFIVLAPADRPVMTEILEVLKEFECTITDISSNVIEDTNGDLIEVAFKIFREDHSPLPVNEIKNALIEKAGATNVNVLNLSQ